MLRSLVGSEMCIRDRAYTWKLLQDHKAALLQDRCQDCRDAPPPTFEERHNLNYGVNLEWVPTHVAEKFVQMRLDEESHAWVESAVGAPIGMMTYMLRNVAMIFMSQYSADGLCGMSNMFVISKEQAAALLPEYQSGDGSGWSLLDVGAGDGGVTLSLAPLFEHVTATEVSGVLSWRLYSRGFEAITAGSLQEAGILGERSFDMVSCFNVLDRCDQPTQLLRELRACAKPNGLVVLAVVLPFCPCVMAVGGQREPEEKLNMSGCGSGASWEQCMLELLEVVENCGFELVRWTRLPYVSRGTSSMPIYTLDDAVLVLTPSATSAPPEDGFLNKSVIDQLVDGPDVVVDLHED
eukprot:TRINITY_DN15132_c0_g1_i1.p1 TRINITY_DN15132_c0_g1~~TRINITY_DN15132_c0_g1_i1.p1  ORF type:complete len:351 (-),score=83.43 TRINITY_DN15132_c0_g1_i1:300-1352(-)